MDTSQIAVLLGGIALIALILWYFFGTPGETKPSNAPPTEHHH